MIFLTLCLNLTGLFLFTCSIKTLRYKITKDTPTRLENVFYKTTATGFIISSLLIGHQHWGYPGWIIAINLTSVNSFIITFFISYFPGFYVKWNRKIHLNYFSRK